jgi:hypothetical protein
MDSDSLQAVLEQLRKNRNKMPMAAAMDEDSFSATEEEPASSRLSALVQRMRAPASEEMQPVQVFNVQKPEVSETTRTVVKTPQTEQARRALESQLAELEKEQARLEQEELPKQRQSIEQKYEALRKQRGVEIPQFQPSAGLAGTLSALDERAQALLAERPAEEKEMSLLDQALVTFGPALAGAIAGRVSGETGMIGAGASAGAQAGMGAIEDVQKARKEKYERELKRLTERNKQLIDVMQKQASAAAEPEKIAYKARAEEQARKSLKDYDLLKAQLDQELKSMPADAKLQSIRKQIEAARSKLSDVISKGPEKTTSFEREVAPAKGERGKIEAERGDPVIIPDLIVMDPNRKWNKKDREAVQGIAESYVMHDDALDEMSALIKQHGRSIQDPTNPASEQFNAAMARYMEAYRKLSQSGAAYSVQEMSNARTMAFDPNKGVVNFAKFLANPDRTSQQLDRLRNVMKQATQKRLEPKVGTFVDMMRKPGQKAAPSAAAGQAAVAKPGTGKVLDMSWLKGKYGAKAEEKAKEAEAKGYRIDRSK